MYKIHTPVELDQETREDYLGICEEMGLTEDEAERMVEDFEMGY